MTTLAAAQQAPKNSFWDLGRKHQQISGTVQHPNGDPRSEQKIKAYAKVWFLKFHLGTFTTDKNGKFHLNYKWWVIPFLKSQTIVFRVFEEKVFCSHKGLKTEGERIVFETTITKKPNELIKDVGELSVELYEYENDLPDLKLPKDQKLRPQHWPYLFTLLRAAFDEKIKDVFLRKLYGPLTVKKVEKIYGVEDPSLEATPEATIDMLLNGIFPCYFKKGEKENELTVDINWDKYEQDESPQLPNAKLLLTNEGGNLAVVKVTIQFQNGNPTTYDKADSGFQKALYLFNSAAILKGEVVSHLGMAHLWSGQAAMAVFRSLNKNPVKALLGPHLKGVLEINRIGRTAIFGPEGILNVSGLTVKGIRTMLKDVLGSMCYKTFQPRKPINNDHRFAKAEQLYWDILTEVVDTFFDEQQSGIKKQWQEIYYLSKNLVNHSAPHIPMDQENDYNAWVDTNEIDDPSVPGRVVYNNKIRSVRPITHNPQAPEAAAIDDLKQFCRYSMFMATFWHWSVHTSQRKWLTNMDFASLAPDHNGEGPHGGTAPENAQRQLSVTHTLTDFKAGALIDNPYKDIYPFLIKKIQEDEKEFADLGYDIKELTYGTII